MTSLRMTVTDEGTLKQALRQAGPRRVEYADELNGQVLDVGNLVVRGEGASGLSFDNTGGPAVGIHGRVKFEDVHDGEWRGHWHSEAFGDNGDPLGFTACRDWDVSHISCSHSTDELFSIFGASSGFNVERSLFYAGLRYGGHSEVEHSRGLQLTGSSGGRFDGYPDDITLSEVLIALCDFRMPQCAGDAERNGGHYRLRRSIVYGWLRDGAAAKRGAKLDVEDTVFIPSQQSNRARPIVDTSGGIASAQRTFIEISPGQWSSLAGKPEVLGANYAERLWRRLRHAARRDWGAFPRRRRPGDEWILDMVDRREGEPGVSSHRHGAPSLFFERGLD